MTLLNNAKWVSVSQFGRIFIQLLSLTILTRLIPPEDYGLMAMGTVIMNFVSIIRDLGTASAIIQRKQLEYETWNSIFWLNILMGILISIIVYGLSPAISYFYANEKLGEILFYLCFCFPLASAGSAHQALMERDSLFQKVAVIELSAATIGFISAILIAYNGGGVYALVFQILITILISTMLFFVFSSWKPMLRFKYNNLGSIMGFSGNLTVFNIVNFFSRNLDSAIVSKKYDMSILGAYSIAYRIMLFPLQTLTFVASRALYPIFSRNQDDVDLIKNIYIKTIFLISTLTFPLMLGVAYLRQPFVSIVLGDQWVVTAELLLWLAPTSIIQAILSCSGSILMATNKSKVLMFLGLFGAFIQVTAFIVGSYFSITMFVFLYFISNIINAFPVLYFTLSSIKLSITNILFAIVIPGVSVIFMLCMMSLVNTIHYISDLNVYLYVLFQFLVGFVSYVSLYFIILKYSVTKGIVASDMVPFFLKKIL